jgi:polyphosphate kinase
MATKRESLFINRELSWLEFNRRILEQAQDSKTPLLERLRFQAIVSSNLDEFFMVRVGGLQMLANSASHATDPTGMTPAAQLDAIAVRTRTMVDDQYRCYLDELEPLLASTGIVRVPAAKLSGEQRAHALRVFEREIYPVLSPLAAGSTHDLPMLANRALHLGVRLRADPKSPDRPRCAVIPLSKAISRIVTLPSDGGYQFLFVEDLIAMCVDRFFPPETVLETVPFRITRNADLSVREDMAGDLLVEMEQVLQARKRGDCVRLEVAHGASGFMLTFLQKAFRVPKNFVFQLRGPIDLTALSILADMRGHGDLRYEPWPPQPSPALPAGRSIFSILANRDVLLYHPFQSFEPVLRLVNEAADDPDVIAIKQILYRTSRTSPIIAALARAAQKGKHVTALVELKARFDEARNIEWADELQDAGVQVVYGVKELKTHAKMLLVVRREPAGLRRYVHMGTGNYNESTAQLYCDASLLTSDDDIGADATMFFNAITGNSQPGQFRKIDMAPFTARERVVELIEGETERKRQGQRAFIKAKMNSLADPDVIRALYAASKAGVKIHLNVRGICCLRPGVPGLSENIAVTSIVDRFLEHARILHVCNGGKERVFMSTADWMPRNFDKRIEIVVPVDDAECRRHLIEILDTCLKDTAQAWRLRADGRYDRLAAASKRRVFRSQEAFYRQARDEVKLARQLRRTALEPYRPLVRKPQTR